MVDTATLIIEPPAFEIGKNHKLDCKREVSGPKYRSSSYYGTTYAQQKHKARIYVPTVTITNNHGKSVLKIQASLPKLLWATNLFEIDTSAIAQIATTLHSILADMGIQTTPQAITNAVIARADFAKIIRLLSYFGEADAVIKKISSFDYKPSSDFDYRVYNEGLNGVSMKFINSTQGFSIYDKLGEIRATGYTTAEQKIIKGLNDGTIRRTALKFELSLQRKDSLEAVLRRRIAGKKKDFTLADILNPVLAKALLLESFDKVFSQVAIGLVSLSEMEDNQIFALLDSRQLNPAKQEKLYYWVRMATKYGIKGTIERLRQKYKGGSFERVKKAIRELFASLGKIDSNVVNLVSFLRNELEEFRLIIPRGKS